MFNVINPTAHFYSCKKWHLTKAQYVVKVILLEKWGMETGSIYSSAQIPSCLLIWFNLGMYFVIFEGSDGLHRF